MATSKLVAVNFNLPLSVAIKTFCVSGIVDLVATALPTVANPLLKFDCIQVNFIEVPFKKNFQKIFLYIKYRS